MADPAAKPRRAPGPGASRALAATLRRHAKPGVVLAPAAEVRIAPADAEPRGFVGPRDQEKT